VCVIGNKVINVQCVGSTNWNSRIMMVVSKVKKYELCEW